MSPATIPKKNIVKTEKTGKKIRFADGSEFDLVKVKEAKPENIDIEKLKKIINE